MGKCSVVASHEPLFSQSCYPTQIIFYLMMNPYQTLLKKNHRFKRGKGGPEQENQSPKIESIQSWWCIINVAKENIEDLPKEANLCPKLLTCCMNKLDEKNRWKTWNSTKLGAWKRHPQQQWLASSSRWPELFAKLPLVEGLQCPSLNMTCSYNNERNMQIPQWQEE